MKTAIYMRVSTEEQAKEGFSLPAQRRKLIGYCDAHDWTIVATYCDEGISGSTLTARPQATQMIEDAKLKKFENILILKVDRLARNTRDLLSIVDVLKKYNVRLNAVEESIDYTTPTGKMMLTMLGSFAELERSTITARTNMGKEQKRLQGYKVGGGYMPFGYDFVNERFIPSSDAPIVSRIYNLAADGLSANSICKVLQEEHLLSPRGSITWERNTVLNILRSETYKGFLRGKLSKNIDPIVSDSLWDTVRRLLEARSSKTQKKFADDDFLFGDVAYCGICGRKLACKQSCHPRLRRYYMCMYNSSKHIHMGDEGAHCSRMENSTFETLFLQYFDNFDLNLKSVELKADEKQIAAFDRTLDNLEIKKETLQKRKAKMIEKMLDETISEEEYRVIATSTQKDLLEVMDNIAAIKIEKENYLYNSTNRDFIKNVIETKNVMSDYWNDMSNHKKRLFISSTFKKISIVSGHIVSVEFRE